MPQDVKGTTVVGKYFKHQNSYMSLKTNKVYHPNQVNCASYTRSFLSNAQQFLISDTTEIPAEFASNSLKLHFTSCIRASETKG